MKFIRKALEDSIESDASFKPQAATEEDGRELSAADADEDGSELAAERTPPPPLTVRAPTFREQCLEIMERIRAAHARTISDIHGSRELRFLRHTNIRMEFINMGREPRSQNTRFKIRFTQGEDDSVILPEGGEFLILWHVVR